MPNLLNVHRYFFFDLQTGPDHRNSKACIASYTLHYPSKQCLHISALHEKKNDKILKFGESFLGKNKVNHDRLQNLLVF